MNKRLIQFCFVALLLTVSAGCAGNNQANVDPAQPIAETPVVPSFLLAVDQVILHSASYTITAKDPARALSDLQRAVEEAGGFVNSASSWAGEGSGDYASLSANVPPEALPALSEAVNKIADKVQNQSVYVQDVTTDFLRLQRRHQDLTQAQDQIFLLLISTKDPDKFSAYGTLRELLDTELRSVENQLESYEEQSRLATLDVTINQPASLLAPLE